MIVAATKPPNAAVNTTKRTGVPKINSVPSRTEQRESDEGPVPSGKAGDCGLSAYREGIGMDNEWYAVRCIFHDDRAHVYEERITVWLCESSSDAIALAEAEAKRYERYSDWKYLGLAQSFHMFGRRPDQGLHEITAGAEVFALCRQSDLPPSKYLTRFFDTGSEIQNRLD